VGIGYIAALQAKKVTMKGGRQLMERSKAEKRLKPVAISWIAGVVIAGAVQMAGAAYTIAPATLQSTGPCLFAEQLQESASIRNQYTARLAAALGGTVSASNSTGIDAFSADCLGCHDGVVALNVRTVLKNNPQDRYHLLGGDHQMIGMDHPIGMDYNRYVAVGKGYKPLSGVSNKMVFLNGKVGCLTCHDPLNPEKGHLVMSDRKSALCYTCHEK
jgi:predicted CXXCH cytochrome family protein